MGYEGVDKLKVDDFERLGFMDPDATYQAVSATHYTLIRNYEGSRVDGYSRGPKHDKLMQASNFPVLESTES